MPSIKICCICQEEVLTDDLPSWGLQCGHVFHRSCLLPAFEAYVTTHGIAPSRKQGVKCPYCNQDCKFKSYRDGRAGEMPGFQLYVNSEDVQMREQATMTETAGVLATTRDNGTNTERMDVTTPDIPPPRQALQPNCSCGVGNAAQGWRLQMERERDKQYACELELKLAEARDEAAESQRLLEQVLQGQSGQDQETPNYYLIKKKARKRARKNSPPPRCSVICSSRRSVTPEPDGETPGPSSARYVPPARYVTPPRAGRLGSSSSSTSSGATTRMPSDGENTSSTWFPDDVDDDDESKSVISLD